MFRSAALSVLAPKMIEKNYMDSIRKESFELAKRLIKVTEINGNVDPLKYLELLTLNVIFNAGFGRSFDSIDDPEFRSLANVVGIRRSRLPSDGHSFYYLRLK